MADDSSGYRLAITDEYVFFNGERIARITGGSATYYYSDQLGSGRILTSATGVIVEDSDYYPFGGERVITAGSNHYKFTGKERDTESSLDYSQNRMYSSRLARWMSSDPLSCSSDNPQQLNRYAYVTNNATNRVDTLGLMEQPTDYTFHVTVHGTPLYDDPVGVGIFGTDGPGPRPIAEKGSGPGGRPVPTPRGNPKPKPRPPLTRPYKERLAGYKACCAAALSRYRRDLAGNYIYGAAGVALIAIGGLPVGRGVGIVREAKHLEELFHSLHVFGGGGAR